MTCQSTFVSSTAAYQHQQRRESCCEAKETESKKQIKVICDAFDDSENGQRILDLVKANHPVTPSAFALDSDSVKMKRSSPYKAGWFAQFRAVFWRSCISILREPAVLKVKLFQTIVSFCLIR